MKINFKSVFAKVALFSLVLFLLLTPSQAMALTSATLNPDGQGNYTSWGGDEGDLDENGSVSCNSSDRIDSATNNARESVNINISSVPNGSTINSVEVFTWDQGNPTGGTYKTFVRVGGVDTDAGANLTTTSTGSCNQKSQIIDIADFVKSGSTDLEVGVLKVGTTSVQVGAIRAIVTYTPVTYTINANAGTGGNMNPTGSVVINSGADQTFTIAPSAGYIVSDVLVDSVSVGKVNTYTFNNVATNHTISGTFDGGWSAPSATSDTDNDVSNESNSLTSNDSDAVFGDDNDEADFYNFNLSIPNGAVIDGIEVAVEGSKTSSRDLNISLSSNNGTSFTAVKGITNFTSADSTKIVGNPTDKWGRTWVVADFSNANFKVRIAGDNDSGDVTVDEIQVKVHYTLDTTAPTLIEVTPVSTPTNDTTPSYVFSSNEAGAVTYGGSCGAGNLANATVGNNTVTFATLSAGTYTNCVIRVTDGAGNQSALLSVTPFTINTNIFDRGLVSLSFDDGYKSVYDNAVPLLDLAGFNSTQYIFTEGMFGATLYRPDFYNEFVTTSEVLSMQTGGHEIAAHTRSHTNLTGPLSVEEIQYEVDGSRLDLLRDIGLPVNSLAYPFGANNSLIQAVLQSAGLSGGRTVDGDVLNNKATNHYALHGRQVNRDTTVDEVKSWIDEAVTKKEWLILIFHRIEADCSIDLYCATPTSLDEILDYLTTKDAVLDVPTVAEGIAMLNNVPVSDGIAPIITQSDVTTEATSSLGAIATFDPVVADFDTNMGPLNAFCTILNTVPDPVSGLLFPTVIASGANFPLGTTVVTCTAADAGGNIGTKTFNVNVVDTTKPVTVIDSATDGNNHVLVSNEVTGSDSVSIAFSATDAVGVASSQCDIDGLGYSNCTSPKVYTNLANGSHTVSVRSTDTSGNVESTAVFTWTVDTEAPVIASHDDVEAEATSNAGAVVAYTLPSVTDNISTGLIALCTPASGSTFALGTTLITCNATDAVGNSATATTFNVNIVDTTKPVIALDGDNPLTLQAGASYVEAGATVTDNYDVGLSATIDSSSVNTSALGSYSVTYNVTDTNGNVADEVTRTVNVIDTTKPVITLVGSTPFSVEVGSVYSDLGGTASDNLDGDLTSLIVTTNSVNTAVVGAYTVKYNVTDANGNVADEVVRTVNVVDTTKPAITLLGNNSESLEVGGTYTDAGATASDNYDGDITAEIVTTNSVNTALVGAYTVKYNVTDANGNMADEVVRTVNVVDTTIPVIEAHADITGVEATSHAGAVVNYDAPLVDDNYDAQFSALCTPASGSTFALGNTTVNCTATDSNGNDALGTTFVVEVVDTTNPNVTVDTPASPTNSTPSVTFNVTDNTNTTIECKVDDGAYTSCVSPFVPNITTDGEHTVTVRATDEGANQNEAITGSFTTDATAPSVFITSSPTNNSYINVNTATVQFDAESGATLECTFDASPVAPCTVLTDHVFDSLSDGLHTFSVTATDNVGNNATATVAFTVDTVKPVVSIDAVATPTSNTTPAITFEIVDVNSTTAECNVDDAGFSACTSPFVTATLADGSHTVKIRATDGAGNQSDEASATFTVDTTAPDVQITAKPLSNTQSDSATFEFTVNDIDAVLECNFDGAGFSVCVSPVTYDTLAESAHTFVVKATDSLGHADTDAFDFTVDQTAPVITITGDNPQILEVHSVYVELGATASDNLDLLPTLTIDTSALQMDTVGDYIVSYSAVDLAGNNTFDTRTVKVVDTTKPVITLLGSNPQIVLVNNPYTEAGATATDNYDVVLSATIDSSSVNTSVLGEYSVTYNVTDANGNVADEVIRTVKVVDSMPPVITLIGANPLVLHIGDTYTDPGATALDDVNGDVTSSIAVGGDTVDTSVMATYTVTYNVSDLSGNTATEVTRTVNVVPVISLESATTAGTTSITITWTTDHPSTSRVVYDTVSHDPVVDPAPNYGYANSTVEDATLVTEHSVTVTGLSSGTTYYLRPVSHGSPETTGNELTSTTSNPQSSGGGGSVPLWVLQQMSQRNINNNTSNPNQTQGEVLGEETFKFNKNLKFGSKGNDVTELQKRLTAEGVYTGPITGYFGKLTREAVKKYQKANDLKVDGIVGPKTRAVLNK